MTLSKKGVPALIVTCAFAMFAVAAIPTHAKAATYINGIGGSLCYDGVCGGGYIRGNSYGGQIAYKGIHAGLSYNSRPVIHYVSGYPHGYNQGYGNGAYAYPRLSSYTGYSYRPTYPTTPDYFVSDYYRAIAEAEARSRSQQRFGTYYTGY